MTVHMLDTRKDEVSQAIIRITMEEILTPASLVFFFTLLSSSLLLSSSSSSP